MKRNIILFMFYLTICQSYAQFITVSPDTVMNCMWQQTHIFPQEKLYISTDKPTYICGEYIWFRAFVVNAISHQPEPTSRYVYLELVNPFDSIVCRIKARQDIEQMIYGHIKLPETLSAGNYWLRGYTRYMENNGDSCFFRKSISIKSPLENSISIESKFNNQSATLRFINPTTQADIDLNNIIVCTKEKQLHIKKENKEIHFSLDHTDLTHKVILIKAGNYSRFIPIDVPTTPDFHIDFLPEGGRAIQGKLCKIGFKALNTNGIGENIKGTIVDNNHQIVAHIQSTHHGMGSFSFVPQEGKTYYAECKNEKQLKKRFKLPEAAKEGYALQVTRNDSTIHISISSTDIYPTDSLIILIHQRGHPQYAQRWEKKSKVLSLSQTDFFTGVAHILLLNSKGRIQNERIIFINNGNTAQAKVSTNKVTYAPREKVTMSIELSDKEGNLLEGNGIIAVIDNHDIKPDSCISILSTLLLNSDLKGHIEDPNWYFRHKNKKEAEAALDDLLLTQGWRYYPVESIIHGDYLLPRIQPETSMRITGKVKTPITGRPVNKGIIRIAAPAQGMIKELKTDKKGRFLFEGFEFPDSTGYIITAHSKKGANNVLLEVNKESFPPVSHSNTPYKSIQYKDSIQTSVDLIKLLSKVNNRMIYENGIRHVFLDEVEIIARKKIEYKTVYQIDADKTITEGQIKQSGQPNIGQILSSLAGLWFNENSLSFRGEGVQIILDGVYQDPDFAALILNTLSPMDIEQIDIIKGLKCLGYASTYGIPGAIAAITTKRGQAIRPPSSLNIAKIEPLGYQKSVIFYSPKYDIAVEKESSRPDLRTTIYWKPNTCIRNRKTEVSFYTADAETSYSIITEGISDKGIPYWTIQSIEVHARY